MMDASRLQDLTGCKYETAARYAPYIDEALGSFQLSTPLRLAHFLAQIGHESGALEHTVEIWGPTQAQLRYEGRTDLGNTEPGDGSRYRGRGLIQTTGRDNYRRTTQWLHRFGCPDFEATPEALEQPRWALLSAAAYWYHHRCNELADADDIERITRAVNGGLNGYEDRQRRLAIAKRRLVATDSGAGTAPTVESSGREPYQPPAAGPAPSVPAGEAPGWEPGPQTETKMPVLPIVLKALAPAILDEIPRIVRRFGSGSEVAERNTSVVEAVLQIGKTALDAANEQELAERIKANPADAQTVRAAIDQQWWRIEEAHQASIDRAREFIAEQPDRVIFWNMRFHEVLALLMTCLSAAGALAAFLWGGLDAQLKGAIVTLMMIGGWNGVKEFFFGGSRGSDRKTELMSHPKA